MNGKFLALAGALSLSMMFSVGCSTKNYVRNQTTPIIDKTNELDDLTAKNTREIRETDARAQKGIQDVQAKASEADQKALAAGKSADEAQGLATQASNRVTSLANTVANLDNYQPVEGQAGPRRAGRRYPERQALHHRGGRQHRFHRPG